MKVLLVNGSPHEKGCTYTALKEAADAFAARCVETEIIWVGNGPVPGCTACGGCASTCVCCLRSRSFFFCLICKISKA